MSDMNVRAEICDPGEIAELVKAGDADALRRITVCYLDRLQRVGSCACRDPESAQDAVQDALLSATERLDQFRGDGSVEAWLSRMVVNACRCRQRGRKNDPSWNRELTDTHAATAGGPEQDAARTELLDHLERALGTLSSTDRALFLLTQVDGFTAGQVASSFELSADAVRARLTRIRRRLRVELDALWRDWR